MVFYTTTCISLAIPLLKLVMKLTPNHLYPLMATLLLYIVLVVVVGALIHVVSYIPFNLAKAFDPIQNDIAAGQIGPWINWVNESPSLLYASSVSPFSTSPMPICKPMDQTSWEMVQ